MTKQKKFRLFKRLSPLLLTILAVVFAATNASQQGETTINAVYFAQTHLQKPDDPNFNLVSDRNTLLKVHVVNPSCPNSPEVTAKLELDGQTLSIPLTGPSVLPESIPDGPGIVQHSFDNSFTGSIPAAWIRPGLKVSVQAGSAEQSLDNLQIGAPNKITMNMFDIEYFRDTTGDYPNGWLEELESKLPVSNLSLRRMPNIVFPELVIPARGDVGTPVVRVSSEADYRNQTGQRFDGEQAAALAWNGALKRAAGWKDRLSLYYINIYGVPAGGQAGGFSGVGGGTSPGILIHELGHALSLPHWGNSQTYPYRGQMHGIDAPPQNVHVGPTWGFDLPSQTFIPPTKQRTPPANEYKVDPMQGGGSGQQESEFIFNHFSDYSVNQMRRYLEDIVVKWNEDLNAYTRWNSTTKDYTTIVSNNNGVDLPIERDVDVISIMASVSGGKPDINMVYPPIGPYQSGLIRLFDPRVAEDRIAASQIFVNGFHGASPTQGLDYSLRIIQGGIEKIYMLPASMITNSSSPESVLSTQAVNLPAADGEVTRVDLLITPDAQINGLPDNPTSVYTWTSTDTYFAEFESQPTAIGENAITMTARELTGLPNSSQQVEYRFEEISGNQGGNSSDWSTNPTFTDDGLDPGTMYRYTVSVRIGDLIIGPSPTASTRTEGVIVSELHDAIELATTIPLTEGSNGFFYQSNPTAVGGDAAQSDDISDSQSAAFTMTIPGPDRANFQWKVSSESDYDFLRVLVNGQIINSISGEISNWEQQLINLPESLNEVTFIYEKDGSLSSGSDTGWVDSFQLQSLLEYPVITSPLRIYADAGEPFTYQITTQIPASSVTVSSLPDGLLFDPISKQFSAFQNGFGPANGKYSIPVTVTNSEGSSSEVLEFLFLPSVPVALGQPNLEFLLNGDNHWQVSEENPSVLVSGDIDHQQKSVISTVLYGPGRIQFDWRTSSEASYDFLTVRKNGQLVDQISGIQDEFATFSLDLDPGPNEVSWTYEKDGSTDRGQDRAYLRNLQLSGYANWVAVHQLNHSIAAPSFRLENDPNSNLMKYSLGLSPSTQRLPIVPTMKQLANGRYGITIQILPEANDVQIEAQRSTDLRTWVSDGFSEASRNEGLFQIETLSEIPEQYFRLVFSLR